jgi:hypothetical protein
MLYKMKTLKMNTFPWKLHKMLELAEDEEFEGIVSWLPGGKSFKVHDAKSFVQNIMPNFFQQSKYKSFQRQCKYDGGILKIDCNFVVTSISDYLILLFMTPFSSVNLWGFKRLTKGPGKGGYTRFEYFVRTNSSELCHIHRRKIKCIIFSSKKTNPAFPITTSKGENGNGNSIGEQTRTKSSSAASVVSHEQTTKSSSAASVVSHSNSDASSISNDSDCDQSTALTPMISPTPIFEYALPFRMSESIEDKCPQTGDCLDFEGRRYFFVDEEEIEAATTMNTTSNIALHLRKPHQRYPAEIYFCPTPLADVPLPQIQFQYW